MTFKKPDGMKYTDLCKYIDKNAYSKDCNDEILYEYIWIVCNGLIRRQCYFTDISDYEQYTFNLANIVYNRIKNKKQFEKKDNGEPKLKKIKSVLNYIKKIIHGYEIRYLQSKKPLSKEIIDDQDFKLESTAIGDLLDESTKRQAKIEFSLYLDDICKTIKAYLRKTPYNNTPDFINVYTSCLLSFLNIVTLKNSSIDFLSKRDNCIRQTITDDVIEATYKKELDDFVILYKLDKSMRQYIRVLTLKIRDLVGEDLAYILNSSPYSDDYRQALAQELIEEFR